MWDFWWKKWHWGRLLLQYFGFPLSVIFCSVPCLYFNRRYMTVVMDRSFKQRLFLSTNTSTGTGGWNRNSVVAHIIIPVFCGPVFTRHSVPNETENRPHARSSPTNTVLSGRILWILCPVGWDMICAAWPYEGFRNRPTASNLSASFLDFFWKILAYNLQVTPFLMEPPKL